MKMDLTNLSSNWKKLQHEISPDKSSSDSHSSLKRKRSHVAPPPRKKLRPTTNSRPSRRTKMDTTVEETHSAKTAVNAGMSETVEVGKYIALDCEMVGVGPDGFESALARVSIVNYNNEQIYDSYVLPKEAVTDWRTPISGIKPSHMRAARTFEEVQASVAEIIKDRIVVGHGLRHDFKALLLDHPIRDIRDTSRLAAYKKITGGTPKLSLLASHLLGLEIQGGEHSSLDDARACMLLFKRDKEAFENKRARGAMR